jgi:hypothetical protein
MRKKELQEYINKLFDIDSQIFYDYFFRDKQSECGDFIGSDDDSLEEVKNIFGEEENSLTPLDKKKRLQQIVEETKQSMINLYPPFPDISRAMRKHEKFKEIWDKSD